MGLISINLKHQPIWIPVMEERGNRDHLVLVFSLNKTWEFTVYNFYLNSFVLHHLSSSFIKSRCLITLHWISAL